MLSVALLTVASLGTAFASTSVSQAAKPVAAAKEKTDRTTKSSGFERFKMVEGYKFSFNRHNCWILSGDEEGPNDSNVISISSGPNCPAPESGDWQMEIDFDRPSITLERSWKLQQAAPRFPMFYKSTTRAGDRDAVIFNEIQPEEKLIDQQDQKNYFWKVETRCGSKNITLSYFSYLNKDARKSARSKPEIPIPFKELVDGFQCDGK